MKYLYTISILLFFCLSFMAISVGYCSAFVYLIFSVSSILMMYICFIQKQFIGALFLSFFLFMGLWFKTTMHFISENTFNEPIGNFNFSLESWNEVLLVAAVGMLGLTVSVFLFRWKTKNYTFFGIDQEPGQREVPIFYIKNWKAVYIVSLFVTVFISYLNLKLGIHQIGLNPKTILPWPINSIISFLINLGLVLFYSVFLFWDIKLKRNISYGFSLICFTSFFTSLSALSRGMFIIQILPYFVSMVLIDRANIKKYILPFILFLSLFIVSIKFTNILRFQYYPNVVQTVTQRQKNLIRLEVLNGGIENVKVLINQGDLSQSTHLENLINEKKHLMNELTSSSQSVPVENNFENIQSIPQLKISTAVNILPIEKNINVSISNKNNVFKDIYSLIINRFIGIEGLMAMQSYEKKGFNMLLDALVEKRNLTTPNIYQEVAKSTYRYTDMNVWQFATLPGVIAFLYYSGSLIVVFFGMFFFGSVLLFVEVYISKVSAKNVFLISLLMSVVANSVAQFGVTPRQDLPFYSTILVCLICNWILIKFVKKIEISS